MPLMTDGLIKAMKDKEAGEAPGEDQITVDLLKVDQQIILEKLASLYTLWLMSASRLESRKNANTILIYKEGTKDRKVYKPIRLLLVMYKVFTKVIPCAPP